MSFNQLTCDDDVSVYGLESLHDDVACGLHDSGVGVWRMSALVENGLGLDHDSSDIRVGLCLGANDFLIVHVHDVVVSRRPVSEISTMTISSPSILAFYACYASAHLDLSRRAIHGSP